MEVTEKQLMRLAGVTLQDVATQTQQSVSTVSRALNDALTLRIKTAARQLVAERQKLIQRKLAGDC
jgi:hypothetical protein